MTDLDQRDLAAALDRLTDARLVFRQGTPPHASYLFKHALVQDAAYGTLLRGPRQRLHAQIANVLEGQFPERANVEPELLGPPSHGGGSNKTRRLILVESGASRC